jgi:hypothetical protein
MKRFLTMLVAIITMIAMSASVHAVRLAYQGQLSDGAGDPVADGLYLMQFRMYSEAGGGTELWDSDYRTIQVTDGLFAYTLGDTVDVPAETFQNWSDVYLGIKVGTDPEMTPRIHLAYSGHSVMALKSLLADQAGEASNAFMLDGNMPSFYLDWSNITSIPAGFADGVDDEATSLPWSAITSKPSGFADDVDDTTSSLEWSNITSMPAG